ncbi:hypothetical protein AALA24_09490 [Anaerovoracaceae bacterium 42-11]|nr:hypothetical protein [Emergencia sp.]
MEKAVRIIGMMKWLGIPLGYIMLFATRESFGDVAGICLGTIAAVSFWILMQKERSRIIGQTIAKEIKEAISIAGNIESFIEIKRMRSGIIARVYLINAKERAAAVHKSISRRIEQCDLKKYLWVMQMTDMPAASSLSEMQKKLNEQLIEELLRRRKGDRG